MVWGHGSSALNRSSKATANISTGIALLAPCIRLQMGLHETRGERQAAEERRCEGNYM